MNYKLTLGLLGVLIVIGAYVYFWETGPETETVETEAEVTRVLSFKAGDVNLIEVSSEGKSTQLKKEGSYWNLTKPEEAEAQSFVVDGLVARMTPLNASRALTETVEPLSTYGLDNPQAEATIGTSANETAVLQVGDNTPDGNSFYVKRKDSDRVYIVASTLISEIMRLVTEPPKALPTPTPTPVPIGTPVPTPTPTP